MRLTKFQKETIVNKVHELLDEQVKIYLFGSRTDDSAQGGDIDILIESSANIEKPAEIAAMIEAKCIMALGEQKIDIILCAPNLKKMPIHDIAKSKGILL